MDLGEQVEENFQRKFSGKKRDATKFWRKFGYGVVFLRNFDAKSNFSVKNGGKLGLQDVQILVFRV